MAKRRPLGIARGERQSILRSSHLLLHRFRNLIRQPLIARMERTTAHAGYLFGADGRIARQGVNVGSGHPATHSIA